MHHVSVIVYLTVILLTYKLAACEWTFSLRISSAQCCSSPTCDQVGTCDDLFLALCLREQNRTTEDRQTCPSFIAGNGNSITNRQLTPAAIVDASLMPIGITSISTPYQGGFQIYIGVLTMPDLPPFAPADIIDEMFVEIVSVPDGGVSSAVTAYGENSRANMTFSSISVECSAGYSGDDCQTLNTCSEEITCNKTLGYCNSDGECICFEVDNECTDAVTVTVEPPNGSSVPTNESLPSSRPTDPTSESRDRDIVPIIVGVVVAVVLLLLVLIIILVVAIVLCRKRREKKRVEMTILTGPLDTSSTTSTTSDPYPTIPLYSTVNKNKKKQVPPKIPEPYQVPVSDIDESNGIVEDVAYPTTQHSRESPESSDEMVNGQAPTNNSQGLVYAELDLHKDGNAAPPPKPPRQDISPQPSNSAPSEEDTVAYTTVNPYSTPRTPAQSARQPGEVGYYSVVRS